MTGRDPLEAVRRVQFDGHGDLDRVFDRLARRAAAIVRAQSRRLASPDEGERRAAAATALQGIGAAYDASVPALDAAIGRRARQAERIGREV